MQKSQLITPEQAQDLAIAEARKGTGFVSPNPLVGCVIVDAQHRFLSSGYHARLGGDHAEVDALKKLQSHELRGATMYVTLEPCSHQGRTPPCAQRIAQEPITKVVAALTDPNPLVAGKGFAVLREKGIQVEISPSFAQKAQKLCDQFLWHIVQKTPFVSLKVGSSLDGRIALQDGTSQWITGESSRFRARQLRAAYDATLIGAGTFLKDNPRLDFRGTEFENLKQNRVVIWDPKKKITEDQLKSSELCKALPRENIRLVTSQEFSKIELQQLYSEGIYSLYVEGGAYVISHFLQKKNFHKLYCFLAPNLLGQGKSWTDHFQVPSMDQKLSLRFEESQFVGEDLLLTARPWTPPTL